MKTTKITNRNRLRILDSALAKAERIVRELGEVREAHFDTSLGVGQGKAVIWLHGPDSCEFGKASLSELVTSFLNSDPDTLVSESSVVIKSFTKAIARISKGAREAQLEIDKNPERYSRRTQS